MYVVSALRRTVTSRHAYDATGRAAVSHAAESQRGLVLASGVGDDDDRLITVQDCAGPGGVLSAEANVHAAGQVRGREFRRFSAVEQLSADLLQRQHVIEQHRVEFPGKG